MEGGSDPHRENDLPKMEEVPRSLVLNDPRRPPTSAVARTACLTTVLQPGSVELRARHLGSGPGSLTTADHSG